MEDFKQAPPKFEDTQPQVHGPMKEVNLDTVEELRITYISWNYDEMPRLDKSLVEHCLPIKPEFHPFQ